MIFASAEGGTTGAQKIVSDPKIIGIIGTSCSGAAVPASQIMSEAGLVMISGSNTSPFLTSLGGEKGNAWQPGYFRTAHNDEVQGAAAANFAYNELGVRKAASIHDGDPYTQGLAMVFNQVFEELGGEIVLATAVNKETRTCGPCSPPWPLPAPSWSSSPSSSPKATSSFSSPRRSRASRTST
ncbi:MAG: ABC transporter substrate-binding protein [Ardenticatenia bacterium]|nr:ABC transporter substrate-binding protein [Ardenticatenia bacterium]